MPSTYAHRYFGEEVRSQLTAGLQKIMRLQAGRLIRYRSARTGYFYFTTSPRFLILNRVKSTGPRHAHREKGSRYKDVKPLIESK